VVNEDRPEVRGIQTDVKLLALGLGNHARELSRIVEKGVANGGSNEMTSINVAAVMNAGQKTAVFVVFDASVDFAASSCLPE
jgi:hypothetical protein